MKLRVPDYYQEFKCLADRCKDSCCIGWEIDIDEETLDYYKSVPGEFGERLKREIREGEDTSFALHNKRCAFLNEKNLCDICIELGETSLCEICLEYPRFTLEYGNTREKCLGMSCEEAGRLMFDKEEPVAFVETIMEEHFGWLEDEGEDIEDEYEEEEMDKEHTACLKRARDCTIRILQDRTHLIEERIYRCLCFVEAIQDKMNQRAFLEFDDVMDEYQKEYVWKKEKLTEEECFGLYEKRMEFYRTLELLDEEWEQVCNRMDSLYTDAGEYARIQNHFQANYLQKDRDYENLLVYFVYRYGMKAVFDYNYLEKVKFAVVSYLVIRDMDGERFWQEKSFGLEERIDVSRIYSKEVEHSEDNLQLIKEALTFEEIFQNSELIRSL